MTCLCGVDGSKSKYVDCGVPGSSVGSVTSIFASSFLASGFMWLNWSSRVDAREIAKSDMAGAAVEAGVVTDAFMEGTESGVDTDSNDDWRESVSTISTVDRGYTFEDSAEIDGFV
jgi:hypothetical protein